MELIILFYNYTIQLVQVQRWLFMKKIIENEAHDKRLVDDDDYEYEKQAAEKTREIKKQQEEAFKKAQQEQIKKQRQEEEEREKRLTKEKLELLQLKNGVIDESECDIKEEHEEPIKLHGKAAIANFWYHYKIWIIFAVFIIAVVAFILKDQFSREKPDLTVLMIADNGLADRQDELEQFFEKYTEDVDGNGYVHVSVIMMPQSKNDLEQSGVNNSKLVAQLQMGQAIMVVTDSNTDDRIKSVMKHDLDKDFPDNKYIDELGLSLNMQIASEELKYSEMPNDVHISLRTPAKTTGDSLETMQKNYDIAFKTFKKMTDDLTKRAEESNDPGLKTEPIKKDDESSSADDNNIAYNGIAP